MFTLDKTLPGLTTYVRRYPKWHECSVDVPGVVDSLRRLLAVKLCYAVNPVVKSSRGFLRTVNCLYSLHVHTWKKLHLNYNTHTSSQTHTCTLPSKIIKSGTKLSYVPHLLPVTAILIGTKRQLMYTGCYKQCQ